MLQLNMRQHDLQTMSTLPFSPMATRGWIECNVDKSHPIRTTSPIKITILKNLQRAVDGSIFLSSHSSKREWIECAI